MMHYELAIGFIIGYLLGLLVMWAQMSDEP